MEQRKRNGITDYNAAIRERREQLLKPNTDKPKTENNEQRISRSENGQTKLFNF